jgi:hypothetical protein
MAAAEGAEGTRRDMARKIDGPKAIAKTNKSPPLEEQERSAPVAEKRRTPRVKVSVTGEGATCLTLDPATEAGKLEFMRLLGTDDFDFCATLMGQCADVGRTGRTAEEKGLNFMLAVVKGVKPRDQIEAMLAAQMAAVHNATMTFARRLAHVDNIKQQDSAQNAFNKLARTFSAQVAALKNYRSKGEQRVLVEHVHVHAGGQAIVGAVTAEPGGVEKTEDRPHALGYAVGPEMHSNFEKEPSPVLLASRQGP